MIGGVNGSIVNDTAESTRKGSIDDSLMGGISTGSNQNQMG